MELDDVSPLEVERVPGFGDEATMEETGINGDEATMEATGIAGRELLAAARSSPALNDALAVSRELDEPAPIPPAVREQEPMALKRKW